MIDIWTEFAGFNTTNQRFADQVRTILKHDWFYDFEIVEIHQQIYSQTYQHVSNTESEILNTEKPETFQQNQILIDNCRNTANTTTHTLT